MAQILSFFAGKNDQEINILVATSGDTGSAVASAFYDVPGIKVILLYPGGKVSEIQEKQLTTFDNNITALEVNGTFDDCQKLVKTAFLNEELNTKLILSSANSINIARLLPQAVYYFSAYTQLKNTKQQIIISVPSGNLGNLTGGIIAKKMGLPVLHYLAALNSNTVFHDYLNTGEFKPRPSVRTISNAMDVGNPSNFHRITEFFANNVEEVRNVISAEYFSDDETRKEIKDVYKKFGYLIDPHGAVGFLALEKFMEVNNMNDYKGIVLETAHPAKFIDVMKEIVEKDIPMPERLKKCLTKEKKSIKISNKFEDFKELLMN
jgi:threonine synthase